MKEIIRKRFEQAEKIILLCDNLNTHTADAFYEAFAADEPYYLSCPFDWSSFTRLSTEAG